MLIVFAIGPEGQYLQRSYAIDDRDEKTAYGSIESIVNRITATVRDIAPENLSSTHVIREVKKNLDAGACEEAVEEGGLAGLVGICRRRSTHHSQNCTGQAGGLALLRVGQ